MSSTWPVLGGYARLGVHGRKVVVPALLDSGAARTIISVKTALELGYDAKEIATWYTMHAAAGKAPGFPVLLDRIELLGVPGCGVGPVPALILEVWEDRVLIGFQVLKAMRLNMIFSKFREPDFLDLECNPLDAPVPKAFDRGMLPVRYTAGGKSIVVQTLLDTGAGMTFITPEMAQMLNVPVFQRPTRILGALKSLSIYGAVLDRVEFNDKCGVGPVRVGVSPAPTPVVGLQFLIEAGVDLDFDKIGFTCRGRSKYAHPMHV